MIAALLGWAVLSERIPRRTWLAMALAAVGVTAMVAGTIEAGVLAVVLPVVMTRVVRDRDRDHALPPRRVDDARDLRLAGAGRRRGVAPFASLGSATTGGLGLFFLLGTFQIGAGSRS